MKGQGKICTWGEDLLAAGSADGVSRLLLFESESKSELGRVQLSLMLSFDGIMSIHSRIPQARSFMDCEDWTGSRIRRDRISTFSCCASTSSFLFILQTCPPSHLASRKSHISNLQLPYLPYEYLYLGISLNPSYIHTSTSHAYELSFTSASLSHAAG